MMLDIGQCNNVAECWVSDSVGPGRIVTGLQIFSSVLLKVKQGSAFSHLITARRQYDTKPFKYSHARRSNDTHKPVALVVGGIGRQVSIDLAKNCRERLCK
jgi:hypothetical protein